MLEVAGLSFRLLPPGGLLCFDDYLWQNDRRGNLPREAIDAFLGLYDRQVEVLELGTRCGGAWVGEVRQIGDPKTGVHWLEEGPFLGGPRHERCLRLQSLTAPTHVRSSRADRHSPFPQNRKEFPVVAFNTPTIRVRLCRAVDDPADAGPGNRPEADRLPDLIASFERHLESPSMIGFARENFQAAVDAKKARLAELRRQENGPAAVDDEIISESTP